MNPGGLLLKRSLTFSNSSFSPERKSSMARLTASMEVISLIMLLRYTIVLVA